MRRWNTVLGVGRRLQRHRLRGLRVIALFDATERGAQLVREVVTRSSTTPTARASPRACSSSRSAWRRLELHRVRRGPSPGGAAFWRAPRPPSARPPTRGGRWQAPSAPPCAAARRAALLRTFLAQPEVGDLEAAVPSACCRCSRSRASASGFAQSTASTRTGTLGSSGCVACGIHTRKMPPSRCRIAGSASGEVCRRRAGQRAPRASRRSGTRRRASASRRSRPPSAAPTLNSTRRAQATSKRSTRIDRSAKTAGASGVLQDRAVQARLFLGHRTRVRSAVQDGRAARSAAQSRPRDVKQSRV